MTASPNAPSQLTSNAHSTKPRILVTSAAGRAATPAVLELLKKGFPVRAFVCREDARSAALRQAGAEVFVGDLLDMRDLRRALVDVQRAYYNPPLTPNLLHGAMLFALAAEEAKLETVALLSQWNPHPSHPVTITREHWIANNVYRWMPNVDVIHVNPGIFAFMYLLSLPMIVHLGMLPLPFGDGLNAPPSNEDIGRVAAGVLADPGPHVGKCYRPTGPELISPQDVAEILTGVVGRKVKYQDVSLKLFLKAATAQGFPTFDLTAVRHYAQDHRGGAFAVGAPTTHVEEITGMPPESFEAIARRYVAQPDLIGYGVRAGTKLGALTLMMKTMLTRAPDVDRWEREHGHALLKAPLLAHESDEWRAAAEQQQLVLQGQTRGAGGDERGRVTATPPRSPRMAEGAPH